MGEFEFVARYQLNRAKSEEYSTSSEMCPENCSGRKLLRTVKFVQFLTCLASCGTPFPLKFKLSINRDDNLKVSGSIWSIVR